VSPDLVKAGLSAVSIIKQAAADIGGGGGGRPDMAQAGGKNAGGIDKALETASRLVEDADRNAGGG
jgi:alanyl-tRNA synthetase